MKTRGWSHHDIVKLLTVWTSDGTFPVFSCLSFKPRNMAFAASSLSASALRKREDINKIGRKGKSYILLTQATTRSASAASSWRRDKSAYVPKTARTPIDRNWDT